MSHPQSFLKWAGGKSGMLKQFEPFFPQKIENYIEPFVGSAAVFFYVKEKFDLKEIILSDNNEELINCYRVVRDDVKKLIRALRNHQRKHDENHYYKVRRRLTSRSDTGRAARLIYLNKTCFNGLYRVNPRGEFNVPMGGYKNPRILDAHNLRSVNVTLQGVDLQVRDFAEYDDLGKPGDFIYFDPPYHPLSRTSSFTSYTAEDFKESDQGRLAEVYRALDDKGCKLMLSNSDCDFVRDLYDGFRIETVRARRAINSKANGRGEINELLILNY